MHLISVAPSIGRISICERITASERRTFAEAYRLTAACDIGRVWIHRGITYFRVKENTPSYRYTSRIHFSLFSSLFRLCPCSLSLSHSLSLLLPSFPSTSSSLFLFLILLPCPRRLHLVKVLPDSVQIRLNFRIRGRVSLTMADCVLHTLACLLGWSETLLPSIGWMF